MSDSQIIVGKVVIGVSLERQGYTMLFHTAAETFIVNAEGDCCSVSWIENVELPALGLPATVLSVHSLELDTELLGRPTEDGDCIAYYGYKIITDKGELLIDFRNDSNGYYGGRLQWPDSGVPGSKIDKTNYKLVE